MDYNEVCQPGQEVYDYARCQRPDGTFYGTSGQCRKGTPVGAKEKVEKKGRKKAKATAETPKKTKPTTLAKGETLEKFKGTETVNRLTARNKELMQRAKENPDEADLIKTQLDKNNKILDKYKKNTEVLDNLVKNAPEGTQISITQKGAVQMDYTTKSGQEVKVVFGNKDYNFQVNGGYDAGTVTDRRQQIEVANAVRRNWEGLVKSLPEGAVVGTAAWTEDGRGASRSRAYERMGFSSPVGGPGGNQYAKKSGGKMVPSSGSEEGLDKTYQFAEKTLSPTALWYVAIFGVDSEDKKK